MELVAGTSLRARFAGGRPLPALDVVPIGKGIARGFAAAHAKGIVHRDLKPENVMVDEAGLVKVLDFGLAKLADARGAMVEILEQQPTDALSTAEGLLLGTPAYMSPEQAAGRPLDARSDLFSLSVVLYEALTGGRPFVGETTFEMLASVMRDTPAPLSTVNPDVPTDLGALVMRCLAKAPDDRPASASELLASLEDLDGKPSMERGPSTTKRLVRLLRWTPRQRCRQGSRPRLPATPTPGGARSLSLHGRRSRGRRSLSRERGPWRANRSKAT